MLFFININLAGYIPEYLWPIWKKTRLIGLVGRMFANGQGDLASIPGRVIPMTLKMVLDTSLLNTQHYKVRIKGKVEQSGESTPVHLAVVAIEKGAFWSPSTTVANFTFTLKVVLDTSLLNTQQYNVRIKGKVEQSWERSSSLPYTSV